MRLTYEQEICQHVISYCMLLHVNLPKWPSHSDEKSVKMAVDIDIINITTHASIEEFESLSADIATAVSEDPEFLQQRNEIGKSALDVAAMLGRTEILQGLIANGADILSTTSNGYSPLHHAATWGRTECLKVLIEAGADLQQRTNYGERARECAVRYGQQECIELIDISEAKAELKALVQLFKDTLADPEKHMGRLNKEDKVTGNRACDEKINWMENNKESLTLEDVKSAKNELDTALEPIFTKLKEQADIIASSKSRTRSSKSAQGKK